MPFLLLVGLCCCRTVLSGCDDVKYEGFRYQDSECLGSKAKDTGSDKGDDVWWIDVETGDDINGLLRKVTYISSLR